MDGEEKVNEDGEGVHDENVSINKMGPELLGSAGFSSRKREQSSTSDVVSNRPFGGDTVRPSLSSSEKVRQKVSEYMPSILGSRGSNKGNSRGSSRGSSRGGISSGGMLSSGEEDMPDTPDTPGSPDSGGGKMPADQSEGSDSEEDANILQDCVNNDAREGTDTVGDTDINDVFDNDDIDRHELIANDALESELDQSSASDVNACIVEKDIGDSIDFATGKKFQEEYSRFHEIGSNPDRFQHLNLPAIMLFIASLVNFVQTLKVDIANYEGKEGELCSLLNQWRIETGKAMEAALVSTGNGEFIPYINLGSCFFIHHVIGIFLHYAPIGCRPVEGELYNHMRKDQCCVSVAKKKMPDFLDGEVKHGIEVQKGRAFGGRTEPGNDKSDQIATVDAIPVLCEKGDSDSKMRAHYKTWTERFGLENFYQLMIIPYCLFQMHILLAQVCHPKKKFQVLVMSSAVALYIFDLGAGIQKYLTRIISDTFEISFVCHPQAWIMGMVRSTTRFPKAVREYMSENLVRVYRNVFSEWPSNFKTKIMDHFGSKYAGLELGIYSRLARLLDISNLLNLDYDALASINVYARRDTIQALTDEQFKTIIEFVKSKLGESGAKWNESHITDFMNELKISHITTVMNRMRKFRSGCKIQSIASEMKSKVKYFWQLPQHLKSMVDAVASVLGQTRKDVFKSVRNSKKAQKVNGKRLSLLNDLATVYNQAGGGETGVAAVEKKKKKLNELKSLLVGGSLAIDMVKNTARAQEINGERFGNLGGMMNKLASTYNNASSEEEGLAAINKDPKLDELALLFPGGKQAALEAVLNTANSCSKSFWENFKKLKKYRKDFPGDVVEVEVNGDMVKVLTIDTSRNSESHSLHQWLVTQNGHRYAKGETEDNWGFKAYKRMGSIEQLALSGIDVTFDTENEVHQKAMDKRLGNKATESVDEEVGDFMTFLGGN